MYNHMACRRLEDITHKQRCSGKHTKKTKRQIWTRKSTHNMSRKSPRQKGKVKFSMYEYIKKMLEELPTNMEGLATTPASSYLFNTDPGCKKLCEEQGQLLHHLVAKLLYLSKRTRQDIQTAVAFLCNRVREPDTDDKGNAIHKEHQRHDANN